MLVTWKPTPCLSLFRCSWWRHCAETSPRLAPIFTLVCTMTDPFFARHFIATRDTIRLHSFNDKRDKTSLSHDFDKCQNWHSRQNSFIVVLSSLLTFFLCFCVLMIYWIYNAGYSNILIVNDIKFIIFTRLDRLDCDESAESWSFRENKISFLFGRKLHQRQFLKMKRIWVIKLLALWHSITNSLNV